MRVIVRDSTTNDRKNDDTPEPRATPRERNELENNTSIIWLDSAPNMWDEEKLLYCTGMIVPPLSDAALKTNAVKQKFSFF